jgi:hypothetical protein
MKHVGEKLGVVVTACGLAGAVSEVRAKIQSLTGAFAWRPTSAPGQLPTGRFKTRRVTESQALGPEIGARPTRDGSSNRKAPLQSSEFAVPAD